MAKSVKKKASSAASSRARPAKQVAKKAAAAKSVSRPKSAAKAVASPAKPAAAAKKASSGKKVVKKKAAAPKAPAAKTSPKKPAAKASAAKSAASTTKAAPPSAASVAPKPTKAAVARKQQRQAAPAKAAANAGLKAAANSSLPSGEARPAKTLVPPAKPYAALDHPPTVTDYDPYNHTPPTDDELRKVKTGLSAKDLAAFREELLSRRADIIGDVAGLNAARSGGFGELSHMPLHMADVGSDNYEQEFTLGLMASERKTIIEIDAALQRIENGIYGVCIESGVPIGRPRLEAKPWAKYCIEVARERERRGM